MPGDFIALHLITSLHAMEQIAGYLSDDQQRYAITCFWTGILCIIFSRGEFPSAAKLRELHARFEEAVDDGQDPARHEEWEQTIARAVDQVEEHNPKLVYVLRRVWQRTGYRSVYRVAAGHFTPTPQALKSS
ncbi:questin oxidase family protein [Streptomyces sp. M19]